MAIWLIRRIKLSTKIVSKIDRSRSAHKKGCIERYTIVEREINVEKLIILTYIYIYIFDDEGNESRISISIYRYKESIGQNYGKKEENNYFLSI